MIHALPDGRFWRYRSNVLDKGMTWDYMFSHTTLHTSLEERQQLLSLSHSHVSSDGETGVNFYCILSYLSPALRGVSLVTTNPPSCMTAYFGSLRRLRTGRQPSWCLSSRPIPWLARKSSFADSPSVLPPSSPSTPSPSGFTLLRPHNLATNQTRAVCPHKVGIRK